MTTPIKAIPVKEGEWKARYVARMAAMIGTETGCHEAAAAAWDDGGTDHTPEQCAEEEVWEWRRNV